MRDTAHLLTTPEAANYLGGLKKTTLEAWRTRGNGPRYVKLGRCIRYRQEDLDAFIEANIEHNTSERQGG